MTRQVAEILKELRQDHRNLRRLLDLLDHEIDRIDSEEDPDYELLHDIMSYMTGYADAVHHRKEDWVYARLAAVRHELDGNLARIEQEHEELGRLGSQLLSDIKAIESGGVMRRLDVTANARSYLARQRDHMRWEDERMFPMVDEYGADMDMAAQPESVANRKDPVFGPEVESRFRSLFDAIRQESLPH